MQHSLLQNRTALIASHHSSTRTMSHDACRPSQIQQRVITCIPPRRINSALTQLLDQPVLVFWLLAQCTHSARMHTRCCCTPVANEANFWKMKTKQHAGHVKSGPENRRSL